MKSSKTMKNAKEIIDFRDWVAHITTVHESALDAAGATSGCCQVQNQQTGGIYQIPTDAATCQTIGGVFTPGPC